MDRPEVTLDEHALALIRKLRDATQQTFDLEKVEAILEKILNESNRVDALLLGIDSWLDNSNHQSTADLSGAVWEHFREKVTFEKGLVEGKRKEETGTYAKRRHLTQLSFIALTWPSTSYNVAECGQKVAKDIYQCAQRWPNFDTDFAPLANTVLLLRHWAAIAKGEQAKTDDYVGRPGRLKNREWACLAQLVDRLNTEIYGTELTIELSDSLQVEISRWLESRDGSLLVQGHRLDIWRPDSTSYYFLEKGQNGLLQRIVSRPTAPATTPHDIAPSSPLTTRLSSAVSGTDQSFHESETLSETFSDIMHDGPFQSPPDEPAGAPLIAMEALRIEPDYHHGEVNDCYDWANDSPLTLYSTTENDRAWNSLMKHQGGRQPLIRLPTSTASPQSSASVCTADFEQEAYIEIEPPNEDAISHGEDEAWVIATTADRSDGPGHEYPHDAEQDRSWMDVCTNVTQGSPAVEQTSPISEASIAETVGGLRPTHPASQSSTTSGILSGGSLTLPITPRRTLPYSSERDALPLTPSSIGSRLLSVLGTTATPLHMPHMLKLRVRIPPPSLSSGPSRPDPFAWVQSSPAEITPVGPLTLGSTISSEGPLSIEEDMLSRLAADIDAHLKLVDAEAAVASSSRLCKARRNWLHGSTQLANAFAPEDIGLGRGMAISSEDAEVCYFTAETFVRLISQGESFACPVIIKEKFTDSNFHDVRLVAQAFEDGYPTAEVDVVMVHDDHPRRLPMSKFVSHVRSGDTPLSAVDLSPAFREAIRGHESILTRVPGYDAGQTAMARARSQLTRYPAIGAVDVTGCLAFNHLATPGAFSGPRVTVLGKTWMRNTTGLQFCLFVPKVEMEESWPAFENQGLDWRPCGKQRLIVLKRDDVLLLPEDFLYVFYSLETTVTMGGVLWDDRNIRAPLLSMRRAKQHPRSTNWRIPDGLPLVIDGLRTLLNDKPERFGCSTIESRSAVNNLIRDLLPSSSSDVMIDTAQSARVGTRTVGMMDSDSDEPHTRGKRRRTALTIVEQRASRSP
ncbi:hypothetical protein LTR86_011262 [Recurvomyces mirabilis]|nr:hypothetical protein LTR86_011262 [Recurvomyces mirabilis]